VLLDCEGGIIWISGVVRGGDGADETRHGEPGGVGGGIVLKSALIMVNDAEIRGGAGGRGGPEGTGGRGGSVYPVAHMRDVGGQLIYRGGAGGPGGIAPPGGNGGSGGSGGAAATLPPDTRFSWAPFGVIERGTEPLPFPPDQRDWSPRLTRELALAAEPVTTDAEAAAGGEN
jgi:hypothetical protein